ncbi:MAG: hypothetical protein IJH17_02265 [Clostridia bacterium]|nr:hypothetical protein [Clostridia bacterium]MBQ3471183.1 hypothetical protein [Clostridia bacterium]MBR0028602.1 hypothetical protein [Clostridia bacterium]MBR0469987.1 hypothetical protein [Clostridia bacterium]
MKSDVYRLEKNMTDFQRIPSEAERVASYNSLDERQARRLRLLSEELIGMLPELLGFGRGEFWIENEGKRFELHVSVTPDSVLDLDKDRILSVSSSGENVATKGIMNKIRVAAEMMLMTYGETTTEYQCDFYDMGMVTDLHHYSSAWSLNSYKEQASGQSEEWDELEKSIIANLADDVIVGVTGKKVEIVVVKNF